MPSMVSDDTSTKSSLETLFKHVSLGDDKLFQAIVSSSDGRTSSTTTTTTWSLTMWESDESCLYDCSDKIEISTSSTKLLLLLLLWSDIIFSLLIFILLKCLLLLLSSLSLSLKPSRLTSSPTHFCWSGSNIYYYYNYYSKHIENYKSNYKILLLLPYYVISFPFSIFLFWILYYLQFPTRIRYLRQQASNKHYHLKNKLILKDIRM